MAAWVAATGPILPFWAEFSKEVEGRGNSRRHVHYNKMLAALSWLVSWFQFRSQNHKLLSLSFCHRCYRCYRCHRCLGESESKSLSWTGPSQSSSRNKNGCHLAVCHLNGTDINRLNVYTWCVMLLAITVTTICILFIIHNYKDLLSWLMSFLSKPY